MKSPGHQKWPDHQVREKRLHDRLQVRINGELVADSENVIEVDEDGHRARFYFPHQDVRTERLSNSDATSECPFKGHASYYDVNAGHVDLKNAVWTYLEPYEEHADLEKRLAFYDDKMPEIEITRV